MTNRESVLIIVRPTDRLSRKLERDDLLGHRGYGSDKCETVQGAPLTEVCLTTFQIPAGSPSRGGDVVVYVKDIDKPTELPHIFLFCS